MKDTYIMHCDYEEHFKLLTDAELGRLIHDVNNYVKNGVLPHYSNEDRVLNMAFSFMKTNIDIETEKYIEKCERNRRNGKRGGRPPKNPEKPNGFENNRQKAKKADTDTDTETDTDTDTETDLNNNSVCNKKAHDKKITCHLGSRYKTESCFYCMKKDRCLNTESADFKFSHPNETFEEWDKRKTKEMEEIIKSTQARGQPVNTEIFDYDWLNDYEETEE